MATALEVHPAFGLPPSARDVAPFGNRCPRTDTGIPSNAKERGRWRLQGGARPPSLTPAHMVKQPTGHRKHRKHRAAPVAGCGGSSLP